MMIFNRIIQLVSVMTLLLFLVACNAPQQSDEMDTSTSTDSNAVSTIGTDSLSSGDTSVPGGDTASVGDTATESADECEVGYSYNPVRKQCVDCSWLMCDGIGENGVHSLTNATGQCICQPHEGYFYSMSELKAVPCDVDMDGWVTVVARQYMEGSDEGLRQAVNCPLRTVDRLVLHPDDDTLKIVTVSVTPFTLYEASTRDEDFQLQKDLTAPAYGEQQFPASALNSLTKACVNSIADYNANGVADIEEWSGQEDLDAEFAEYAPYAYFVELHTGWYESPPADSETEMGAYHIAERHRAAGASVQTQVPLDRFDEDTSPNVDTSQNQNPWRNYWRSCRRRVDHAYDANTPQIGMDFAWASASESIGANMFHHSQFKCIQSISNSVQYDAVKTPHLLNPTGLSTYALNRCELINNEPYAGFDETVAKSYNPSRATFSCSKLDTMESGDVAFGVVEYKHYLEKSGYQRGCINECVHEEVPKPAYVNCNGNYACATDWDNYGLAVCGCEGNYDYETECKFCRDRWDLSTKCATCLGNWDVETDCRECLEGWDAASECTDCAFGWDEATGCTTCKGRLDEYANCEQCYNNDMFGHWTGEDCNLCIGNWDQSQNCLVCRTSWIDNGDDCGTCPNDILLGGHWDPEKDCAECIQRHRNDIDDSELDTDGAVNLDFGFWDIGAFCKECQDLWVSEDSGCSTCGEISMLGMTFPINPENNKCVRTNDLLGPLVMGCGAMESDCLFETSGIVKKKDDKIGYSSDTLICPDDEDYPQTDKGWLMTKITGPVTLLTPSDQTPDDNTGIAYHIADSKKLKYIHVEVSYLACSDSQVEIKVEQYALDENNKREVNALTDSGEDHIESPVETPRAWHTVSGVFEIKEGARIFGVILDTGDDRHVMFDDAKLVLSMNKQSLFDENDSDENE